MTTVEPASVHEHSKHRSMSTLSNETPAASRESTFIWTSIARLGFAARKRVPCRVLGIASWRNVPSQHSFDQKTHQTKYSRGPEEGTL
ncbi:unnamed protein product, partial [Prorocentrum cordatum]